MSQAALYTPDRLIVAAIQAIDPDLAVSFADPPGRYAVYHQIAFEGNSEAACLAKARELQDTYRERGYVVDLGECERQAFQTMQDANLVCYVANEDGSFRPLDQRIVDKLRRMDHLRRNCGLRDWKLMLSVKADALRAQRERDERNVWDSIRSDKTFANAAHDILWGLRPTRSVMVPGNYVPAPPAE